MEWCFPFLDTSQTLWASVRSSGWQTWLTIKRLWVRILLFHSIYQGWPKCGPPKIFCGPCVKFWMHNSAIYDTFMYENTLNLHQFTSLCKKKIRQKIFCGLQYNISRKFGPPEKKSGHPCNILYGNGVLWHARIDSCTQFWFIVEK